MKHLSFVIENIKMLEETLSSPAITSHSDVKSVLVQIYSASTDQTWINKVRTLISNHLPQAIVVGATTVGEVIFGKAYIESTVVGFSFFETATLSVISRECEPGNEFETGKRIANEIAKINETIVGTLLLSTPLSIDAATLLHGFETSRLDYPLFGGGAGDYASMQSSWVFSSEWFSSQGAVAVIFKGQDLHIDYRTYLGWRPLSKQMTITKAEGMRVKTIDGKPAFEIYDRYLGLPRDENFFLNVLEFPLLLERDGEELARVPVFVDDEGGIQFVADIREGERFRIGYGDPNLIIADSTQIHQLAKSFQPQAIFLYTCGCRRFLMQEEVEMETTPFEELAPTFGFYTYGEFFGTLSNTRLLNSTMVVVSFREGAIQPGDNELSSSQQSKNPASKDPYLQKHGRIISRLVHFVEAVTSEVAQKNKELERLYVTDQLTGLFNRHKLDEVLITELDRVQRYAHSLGIILMDVDYFKSVNDSYGHQVGDQVLCNIAHILQEHVRKTDIVGRWGGEEFLIVCPETSEEGLMQLAEKLRNRIEHFSFPNVGSKTASFGVALYQEGDTIDRMILKADTALYQAKNKGRNRVEVS